MPTCVSKYKNACAYCWFYGVVYMGGCAFIYFCVCVFSLLLLFIVIFFFLLIPLHVSWVACGADTPLHTVLQFTLNHLCVSVCLFVLIFHRFMFSFFFFGVVALNLYTLHPSESRRKA
ncbi:hypothetical protein, unlikely [Trypanosoma brucei gambiense DAL972]|uniref:Uncharacterized protein n=1 Tax=Trypanosoma brucei gambiense (strain MHOM/CI/86/DAL972) TaxID=679716 RepID=D0A447_TRYB9|nr:hypothetical protein, unlikely [Trypanosoma brucei gambiense DAL972]CBH16041.1 hypothetical protein, unlikely [Trypanosoma brucei gambiense DAL972]|eukprot:XP_011778305.1 hypothetical protein, unlikely [Trypanosoma brucei gambiense DAL972]